MTCNIVFDFHSPHNNEYWYRCTYCDASDWFSYYDKPAHDGPIIGCKANDPEHNYKVQQLKDLQNSTKQQLLQQILHYRTRISELEAKT
jgi:hypothetical protein